MALEVTQVIIYLGQLYFHILKILNICDVRSFMRTTHHENVKKKSCIDHKKSFPVFYSPPKSTLYSEVIHLYFIEVEKSVKWKDACFISET